MASGNAILAGILSGIGGAGTAIGGSWERDQKEALERARLEQERDLRQQVIDAQAAQFEATQAAAARKEYTPLSDIAAMYSVMGLTPPADLMGTGRVRTELVPGMLTQAGKQQELAREQATRSNQAGVLERLGAGSPGTPAMAPPDEGAMYSEGMPATAATPANPRYQAIAGLLREGPLAEYLVKALDAEQQKVGHAPAGSAIYDPQGKIIGMVPALPKEPPKEQGTNTHVVQTAQGQVAITVNAQGQEVGRVRVGDLPPRDPKEPPQPNTTQAILDLTRQRQALLRQGVPETDRRVVEVSEQIDNIKSYILGPGGQVIGAGSNQPRASVPASPSAGTQQDVSDIDNTIATFANLSARAKSPEVSGMLGVTSAPRRFLEDKLNLPMLTDPQRQFRAEMSIALTDVKKSRLGLNQTKLEQAGLLPALPTESDPGLGAKLDAWVAAAQRNRAAIEATLGSLNIKVPNASGAKGGGGGAAPKRIKLDAQGNPVP